MREPRPDDADDSVGLTSPATGNAAKVPSLSLAQRRFVWRLARARSWWGRRRFMASRFLFVPPHLHLADPTIASDFLSGQVVLGGRTMLAVGRLPFDLPAPCSAFAIAFMDLTGFAISMRVESRTSAAALRC